MLRGGFGFILNELMNRKILQPILLDFLLKKDYLRLTLCKKY